jgi:tetratricopeptide (TPR) repeat protein
MYEAAAEVYKELLALEPESETAHYEIAFTYMYMKNYEKALEHSEKVVTMNGPNREQGIIIQGSCLDDLGKRNEAIEVLEKGIKKYGPSSMMNYNLALTYYRDSQLNKAKTTLEKGIEVDKSHASSHLILGLINAEAGFRVPALLSLHHFLILEPATSRSQNALDIINEITGEGVSLSEDGSINVSVSSEENKEFHATEVMISLLSAINLSADLPDTSQISRFTSLHGSVFKSLGESKKKKNKGLYWEYYIPMFDQLARSEHFETYCRYVTMSKDETSSEWITVHPEKLEALAVWFDEYK